MYNYGSGKSGQLSNDIKIQIEMKMDMAAMASVKSKFVYTIMRIAYFKLNLS